MPFTFSHPAAVLPLKRCFDRLSLPALIAGSISPDFEYFIRMKSKFSHTWHGIFWLDVPISLTILFLFFYIVRDDLIDNLPKSLQRRFYKLRQLNFLEYFKQNALMVIVSVILGAFTHILWDSFTHASGFMVSTFSVFRANIFLEGFPVYRFLQHISTLFGGIIILRAIYKLPQEEISHFGQTKALYFFLLIAFSSIYYLIFSSVLWREYISAWHKIIFSISALLVSLCTAPFIIKLFNRPTPD